MYSTNEIERLTGRDIAQAFKIPLEGIMSASSDKNEWSKLLSFLHYSSEEVAIILKLIGEKKYIIRRNLLSVEYLKPLSATKSTHKFRRH